MNHQRATAFILFILAIAAGLGAQTRFQVRGDGRAFQLGTVREGDAVLLGFAGTTDLPGVVVQLEQGEKRSTLESDARQIAALGSLTAWSGLVLLEADYPVYFVAVRNGGALPAIFRLHAIFDIPERGDYPRIKQGDTPVESESHSETIPGFTLILEDDSAISLIPQGGEKPGQTAWQARNLIVANTRRLLAADQTFVLKTGRDFSFMPFVVKDRGLRADFGERTVLPGQTAWYALVFGDAHGDDPAGASLAAAARALASCQSTVQNALAGNSGASNAGTQKMERINQVLSRIRQVMAAGTLDLEALENLYAELEKLEAGTLP